MAKIVTVSAIMDWEESDVKKLESFMKKLEKYGWDIEFFNVTEIMMNRDRDDIVEWYNVAAELMLEEMCECMMEHINSTYADDELDDIYFKISEIKDDSYNYVEVDENFKITINCPFKMFKVNNFSDLYEVKFEEFVEKMKKFELN